VKIGIVGAGMIGATMAKLWADAGHEVLVASRQPDQLQPLIDRLGPRASAGTAAEAASFGDVVMLTVPLKAMPSLAITLAPMLAGKVVIDTGNAYERRDGEIAAQARSTKGGSAVWAARMFPASRWVKAFNTVFFKVLESEAHREGDKVGIPLAGDDRDAVEQVAALVRDAGFDPVITGPLAQGQTFEPDTPVYNTGMTGSQVRQALGVKPV